mgnify:CR=1 FL=1
MDMKRIYKIPEHSRYITVEATEEGITTIFEPDDTGAFMRDNRGTGVYSI